MATGQTSHVSSIAIESDEGKTGLALGVVGSSVDVVRSMTHTTNLGTASQQQQVDGQSLHQLSVPNQGNAEKTSVTNVVSACCEDGFNRDFDISCVRSNGNQDLDCGHEGGICNGDIDVDFLSDEAMGNSIGAGCTFGSTDDVKTPNGFVVGNGGVEGQNSNSAKACQAVRPKTISWSRLVKQRKEKKDRNKKQNNVRDQSRGEAYLYPEMYSSSEEEMDDISDSKTLHKNNPLKSSGRGASWNLKMTCESCDKKCVGPCLCNGESKENWDMTYTGQSVGSSPQVGLTNGNLQSCLSVDSTDSNGSKSVSSGCGDCPPFDPVLMVRSDCILAPLAVPEDSGGSSLSSESDFNPDDCDTCYLATCHNDMCGCTRSVASQREPASQDLDINNISCEENMPKTESENKSTFMPFLPNAPNQQLMRQPSNDSLDEIGDYIETDFPSQASRQLFNCSSTSSSSTSSDEDEGYGVNAEPRIPDFIENDEERNEQPVLPLRSLQFHDVKESGFRDDESESRVLILDDSLSDVRLGDRLSGNACSTENDSATKQAKRLSRLGSATGRSESGSELGGMMGSDSSAMYSPEADYLEFVDSDLPASAGLHHSFSFVRDAEVLTPFLSDVRCYPGDCDGLHQVSPTNSCEGLLVDGAEAAASLTNNLNYDRCCSDFEDNNMERYDPHLLVDPYCNPDLCKQENVPGANFQNSASNRREKIFYKAALDRENGLSGSSDEEENVSHSFMRDVASNLESEEERAPQNSNTECMYIEDLENLTHALQNAVIMQLPPKLEESSGESSDEPIYEEIECLEPFLSGDSSLHVVKEEMIKPADNVARVLPKYERRRRRGSKPHCHVEKVMIWNEYEAYVLQVKQIGTSACGPTAILNVMKAFDYQVDKDDICKTILANLRMEAAPIPYYLFSRAAAGTTAESLLDGVEKLTKGAIRGRFFHFYPARKVDLLKWLGYWIKKGAVPIATLNLQRGVKPGWTIPDAWHHQMVYGVGCKGIYLTNPLEIVAEETVMDQLTSDSVLLIRRQDVVNRFRDWAPLNDFLKQRDTRWQTMNVLGQVVNVLREACTALSNQIPRHRAQLTYHITIPAAYKAGVTLFVRQNSDVAQELFSAQDLEMKDGSEVDTEILNGVAETDGDVETCSDSVCATVNPS